jgi:aspartate/glutamate racemase
MQAAGADAVVLACTELPLIVTGRVKTRLLGGDAFSER